jgi:C_GCAxxG_C_C family probable redox protein
MPEKIGVFFNDTKKEVTEAMDVKERVLGEKLKGHCCSESIMAMFLEDADRENDDLVKAMRAFCGGMREGLVCGAIAAAISVIFTAAGNYDQARDEMRPEMMKWFLKRYGSYSCADLLAGDETRKITLCPIIVEETYCKLAEILEDAGAL